MKTISLSFICIFISVYSLNAQIVNIPDQNFKNYLINEASINTNGDTEIQISEAQAFTGTINCGNKNISDLTGIEAFTACQSLYCHQNQLSSIDLSSNTALTYVNCRDNGNQLTSIDFGNNPNLTRIVCYNNGLTSMVISGLTNLESLDCKRNQLTSLDLSNKLKLDRLVCNGNQLTSLDLTNDTSLTELYCQNNQLSSLDLSTNIKLEHVECHNNQYSSLNLGNNTSLEYLQCSNSSLTDLDVSGNTGLKVLFCYSNQLSNLDLTNNTLLEELSCSYNTQLGSLSLANNTALLELNCSNTGLTSLDLSNNTALVKLFCKNNQISQLDISTNPDVDEVSCSDNQLTSLNVANGNNWAFNFFEADDNPGLYCIQVDDVSFSITNWSRVDSTSHFSEACDCSVEIPDNKLRSKLIADSIVNTNGDTIIDCAEARSYSGNLQFRNDSISDFKGIEAFTNLQEFNCSGNDMNTLDLSENTALIALFCENNHKLSQLNIANGNNRNMTDFMATGNPKLECIQVDDSLYSSANWFDIDSTASFSEQCSSPTATNNLEQELITIYPNPTSEMLHISTIKDVSSIRIHSLLGERVYFSSEPMRTINVSNLSDGMYVISFESEGKTFTKVFGKE